MLCAMSLLLGIVGHADSGGNNHFPQLLSVIVMTAYQSLFGRISSPNSDGSLVNSPTGSTPLVKFYSDQHPHFPTDCFRSTWITEAKELFTGQGVTQFSKTCFASVVSVFPIVFQL